MSDLIKINKDYEIEISEEKEDIKKQFEKNKKNVINFLVTKLLEVDIELPESLRKKSKKIN